MLNSLTVVRELRKVVSILLFLAFLGANAQERYNFLAVNGETLENIAGPFYFTEQGNNKDSYARADLLAQALGLSFNLQDEIMYFNGNGLAISLKATTDITTGLNKRPDVMIANNQAIESPMGIIVDDNPYVGITAISKALGGQSGWEGSDNLIWIHYDPEDSQAVAASATPVAPLSAPQPSSNVIAAPRHGLQKEGHTRIVLDLPPGSFYELYAFEKTFMIKLPNLMAGAFNQALNQDPNLANFRYGLVDNTLALEITTRYPLDPQGIGYRFSLLAANAEIPHERLMVEFSPSFTSQAVASAQGLILSDLPVSPVVMATPSQTPAGHQKVVVIDAGHGGDDPGATGYATEKEVVLSVALKLKDLLEAQGIKVILTRDRDYFLELDERADFATPDINLFIAIHANAAQATEAHGLETWVFGQPLEPALLALAMEENGGFTAVGQARTEEALEVATGIVGDVMLESQLSYSLGLAELVQKEMVSATGAKNRGVRQNAFYVLRKARSPSILIEIGFVSNPTEGSLLATDDYRNKLAQAIASGIISFFNHGGIIAQTP